MLMLTCWMPAQTKAAGNCVAGTLGSGPPEPPAPPSPEPPVPPLPPVPPPPPMVPLGWAEAGAAADAMLARMNATEKFTCAAPRPAAPRCCAVD